MVQYGTWLATGLPIVILLPLLGGTSWVEFFTLLIAAGVAAEGVTTERAGDMGRPGRNSAGPQGDPGGQDDRGRLERPLGADLARHALVGRASHGALHPLGFAAAVVLLGVATWFMVALGTFMSLVRARRRQASNRTLIPVLLLSGSFLIGYVPTRYATILMGLPRCRWSTGCRSCLTATSARSSAATGRSASSAEIGVSTGDGPFRVLATFASSTTGTAAAAAGLTRTALARFTQTAESRTPGCGLGSGDESVA